MNIPEARNAFAVIIRSFDMHFSYKIFQMSYENVQKALCDTCAIQKKFNSIDNLSCLQNFQKLLNPSWIILRIQGLEGKQ